MIRRSKPKRAKSLQKEVAPLIRTNTVTVYGLYFATSNTDFLLDEKETRFSVRPDVILKKDRQTTIFDYSAIKGSEQASIFDGFFRGLQEGTTCAAGVTGCSGATCCGSTLGLAGAITTTCNFINDVTGIPNTDFADTYTLSKVDVTSKTIVAIKETPITTTTAVQFNGDYFIDLPQWTKTQKNQISTPVKKIINLLSSQSLEHLGIRTGSVLEFKKTKNNNSRFTVVDIYNENGFEVIEVDEEITKEDVTDIQVIVSVYGEESIKSPVEESSSQPYTPAIEWSFSGVNNSGVSDWCTDPPEYGDEPRPIGGDAHDIWKSNESVCCACLVYAEGECNNDQCQECTAWVAYNRIRSNYEGGQYLGQPGLPGGTIPKFRDPPGSKPSWRKEDSFCDQVRMPGRWEGGWEDKKGNPNKKFRDCFCAMWDEGAEEDCINKAQTICNSMTNFPDGISPGVDPTGGANYFFQRGRVPDWMLCNLKKSADGEPPRCKRVTGLCASCGNEMFICNKMPKDCNDLGVTPTPPKKSDKIDDTPVLPA